MGEADNGEMGCELYLQCQPAVAILDLSMPGIGGLETLRRIRAKYPTAQVLALSMHDSETLMLRAMEAGAAGYLTKQSGIEQMVEAVRQVAQGELFIDPKHVPDLMQAISPPRASSSCFGNWRKAIRWLKLPKTSLSAPRPSASITPIS